MSLIGKECEYHYFEVIRVREFDDGATKYSSPTTTHNDHNSPIPCDYNMLEHVAHDLAKKYGSYTDCLSDAGLSWTVLNNKCQITSDARHNYNLIRQATQWRIIDRIRAERGRTGFRFQMKSLDELSEVKELDSISSLGEQAEFNSFFANLEIEWIAQNMNPRVHAFLQGMSQKDISRELGVSPSRVRQMIEAGMHKAGYRYEGYSWVERS